MRTQTTIAAILIALATAGCSDDVFAPEAIEAAPAGAGAPVLRAAPGTRALPGRWIVVLEPGARPAASVARELTAASGGVFGRAFGGALRGFTAELSEAEVERLRQDPAVAYIEQDALVSVTSAAEPWNLERIGQGVLARATWGTSGGTGAGVHAYVIDTGIRTTHAEFGGRASSGFDAIDGGAADDCNGHGTHVAGTLGGETMGVARRVSLVAVRVLDCGGMGTVSDVVAGIDWVAAHHQKPAVANLSLAGGASRAVDEAVQRAIDAGVVFVVAAGNDARDACDYSPARASAAITVGATTSGDAVWTLSNQGSCVDLFAPGEGITAAWHTDDRATHTLSGTSMAAPHAAGAAAIHLESHPTATPAQVESALRGSALGGRLTRLAEGSANLLLQVRPAPSWEDLRDRR